MGLSVSTVSAWRDAGRFRTPLSPVSAPRVEDDEVEVACECMCDEAALPMRETPCSAGSDLRATEALVLPSGKRALVGTGVKLALSETRLATDKTNNLYGAIKGRSSLALKGIDVHPGTVDGDYRGEIKVLMINNSGDDFQIMVRDRIAQLVIEPAVRARYGSCDDVARTFPTARGAGGFGSTGRA